MRAISARAVAGAPLYRPIRSLNDSGLAWVGSTLGIKLAQFFGGPGMSELMRRVLLYQWPLMLTHQRPPHTPGGRIRALGFAAGEARRQSPPYQRQGLRPGPLVLLLLIWLAASAPFASTWAQSGNLPAGNLPVVEIPALAPAGDPPVVVAPLILPAGSLAEAIAVRLASGLASLDARRPPDAGRLRRFYEQRGYLPAWFSGDGGGSGAVLLPTARILREVSGLADREGLLPADYHLSAIDQRLGAAEPVRRAELELLLTDALMVYASDLHRGRVAPRAITEEFAFDQLAMNLVESATAALAAPDLWAFLAALAPNHSRYTRLREALRIVRAQDKSGGWPKVPEGPKLEPGMSDPVVRALRRRLAATGEFGGKLAASLSYDSTLVAAVQHFQARHGLRADGVIGTMTYAALNVSAAERVICIIANMERERWMPDELGPRYVLVNIPGFNLRAVVNGKVMYEMPVIVGTKIRRTPIFVSQITSLIWNPTWSVPSKLAREDILPKLKVNPGYLEEQGIVLYDGSFSGGKVNPGAIKWETFTDINRFRLRQMPGAHNALGQVKFNIPNDFDVYLHDTPHREKFIKSVRTFSSGCVRVGNPLGLANFLLDDMPEWTPERRALVLDKGETRNVVLRTSIPVFLLYQTAWIDDKGVIQFRDDIYERDLQVFRAIRRFDESAARLVGTTG